MISALRAFINSKNTSDYPVDLRSEDPFSMTPLFDSKKTKYQYKIPPRYPDYQPIYPKQTYEVKIVPWNEARKTADENFQRNVEKAEEEYVRNLKNEKKIPF